MRLAGFGAICWTVLSALLLAGQAQAQGSGHEHHSNPNNTCPLMAGGMHEMHVSAYHPSVGLEELCTEIPGTGRITITLDAVSPEIRDMTTEIKLVKGDGTTPDPVTLAYLPAQRYPSGVATFTADLGSPGQYALLVTLREGAMEMAATHVITVTHPMNKWVYVPVAATVVLAAAAFFYFRGERRKKLRSTSS